MAKKPLKASKPESVKRANERSRKKNVGGSLKRGISSTVKCLATVRIGKAVGEIEVKPRKFKTGSVGFFGFGKVALTEKVRYQVQVQAVLIGSGKGGLKK